MRPSSNLEAAFIRRTSTSTAYLQFAFLCLVCSALSWRPLVGTFALALHDDASTHILLILPISAALIWSERKSQYSRPSGNVAAGVCLIAFGILTAVSTRWLPAEFRLSVGMAALVTLWIAVFVLCFGTRRAQSVLFPLCFLFWMVPIPSVALVKIVQLLQRGSAVAAELLFSAFGVPSAREGILLSIPGLNIEVARECSSIRSSLMLLVTTMVLAQVLLRTPWRKILIILFAIPLSVAKNGLRIFAIGMLTTRVDPSFLTGRFHHNGGVVFFLIALGVIFLLLWILRRGEGSLVSAPDLSPARP